METIKNKTVKTRKEHYCFACYRKSPIGTKMNYWAGTIDGDFSSCYTCMTCDGIMELTDTFGEGYPYGFVAEGLEKDQTPEDYLKKLKKSGERLQL